MPPRATDGDSRNSIFQESRRSRVANSPPVQLELFWDDAAQELEAPKPRTLQEPPNVRPVTGDVAGFQARPEQSTDRATIHWTKVLSCTKDGWTLFERYSRERKISTGVPDTAKGKTYSGDTKGNLVEAHGLIEHATYTLYLEGIVRMVHKVAEPIKSMANLIATYVASWW
jgi:hypothetical protein